MQVEPADFTGWGVFEPVTWNEAIYLRATTLLERQQYLDLLLPKYMIVGHCDDQRCLAMLANRSAASLASDQLFAIQLANEVRSFDTIVARYDGAQFWFDRLDSRAELAAADYLRESLAAMVEPADLDRRGLTGQQRRTYAWLYEQRRPAQHPRLRRGGRRRAEDEKSDWFVREAVEHRLRENLNHAGAQLVSYREWGDLYQVTYQANGERHTSAVQKNDLTVASAGICLDGEDAKFDLASLVGVLDEGRRRGEIYRM